MRGSARCRCLWQKKKPLSLLSLLSLSLLLSLVVGWAPTVVRGQAVLTAWAGTAQAPPAGGTDLPWTGLTEATGAPNAGEARCGGVGNGESSDVIYLTNFGLSLPAGATVVGIEANVTLMTSRDTVTPAVVSLAGPDAANSVWQPDTNRCPGACTQVTRNTLTAEIYGSPTDLWGLGAIAAADVAKTNFGVAIQLAKTGGMNANIDVDAVGIAVYYNVPSSTTSTSTTTSGGASSTSTSSSSTSSANPTTTTTTTTSSGSGGPAVESSSTGGGGGGDNLGLIIGISVGGGVLCIILVVVAVVVIRKRSGGGSPPAEAAEAPKPKPVKFKKPKVSKKGADPHESLNPDELGDQESKLFSMLAGGNPEGNAVEEEPDASGADEDEEQSSGDSDPLMVA